MEYVNQMPAQVAGLPLSLVVVSLAAGILMMLGFKLASNPRAIRAAKRRVQAQLLALRLFGDEPALVWRAQLRLLAGNIRYLAVMLLPIAAAAIPFLLAYPHLEALYGRAPVPVGSQTQVTVKVRSAADGFRSPRLDAPAGLLVETPPVRISDATDGGGEICWRLLASGPVSGPVRIRVAGAEVTKSVQVGKAGGYLSETRAGLTEWLFHPGESPIGGSEIESVQVLYRTRHLSAFGLEWPWEAWFIAISVMAAMLVKNRLGVEF